MASVMALFEDHTYIGRDQEAADWKYNIERRCMAEGYIPLIDWDDEFGWVWHTLFTPDGLVSKKTIAARFETAHKKDISERDIEDALIAALKIAEIPCARQVRCRAGILDVITSKALYEVKLRLSREVIFHAVGQVLIYRAALNAPQLTPFIVGMSTSDTHLLRPIILACGVSVLTWEPGQPFKGANLR